MFGSGTNKNVRYTRVPQTNTLVAIPGATSLKYDGKDSSTDGGEESDAKKKTFKNTDLVRFQTYTREDAHKWNLLSLWEEFPLKVWYEDLGPLDKLCSPYRFPLLKLIVCLLMTVLWVVTVLVLIIPASIFLCIRPFIYTDEALFLTNFLAGAAHLALALVTFGQQGDAKDDIYFNRPALVFDCEVSREDFRWGSGMSLGLAYEVEKNGLDAKLLTGMFFMLSFVFHLIYVLMTVLSWWSQKQGDSYYTQMLTACNQPLRFLEYSFSSALMIFLTIYLAGTPDFRTCFAGAALLFVTNTYGWLCECLSPPNQNGTSWVHASLFRRWAVNILGYVPFLVAYYLVLSPSNL